MTNRNVVGIEAPILSVEDYENYATPVFEDLARKNVDLVLFPEKWISNVFVEGSESFRRIVETFSKMSGEYGFCIVPGSLNIQRTTGLYNSAPVFYGGELLGWQDKIIPFAREKKYYRPGKEIRAFHAAGLNIGVQVCYDLDFPFVSKIQALKGVDVILNPSLILKEFHNMWHLYVRTRSLENRIPVISVNSVSDPFYGGSVSTSFSVREAGIILRTHKSKGNSITCSVNRNMVKRLSSARRMEDPGNYELGKRS